MSEHESKPCTAVAPRILAEGLCWQPGTEAGAPTPLLDTLGFAMGPGLHLVQGGEGRGKTALLSLLAGALRPVAGRLERRLATLAWPEPLDAALDGQLARDWLASEQGRHPRWNAEVAALLLRAWALEPHLTKQLHMLSAGSRRKLGLVAAAASGADLVLLDLPFAALDGSSRRVLLEVLEEAAKQRQQIWVMADYAAPAGLDASVFASRIDLGD
ncbi:ATP-binding cassette domain-containing protein [Roseateles sp. DB2]|uniref:ATP-binding cassette domain-containing protein n=1 Tax=Roseateles sp. DB2 TaxID=3453717 RepID=UPI003EE978EE